MNTDLFPGTALEALSAQLEGGGLRVASVPVEGDPLELVRSGAALFATCAYFGLPGGEELGGLGAAWRYQTSGPARFEHLADQVEALSRGSDRLPVLFGSSFSADGPRTAEWDGFPSATALVPSVTLVRDEAGARLLVAVPPGRPAGQVLEVVGRLQQVPPPQRPAAANLRLEARPPIDAWLEKVDEAVAAVESGSLRKVVLARSVVVGSPRPPAAFDLVARLRDAHPGCYAFGWQEGASTFIGASPELLAARRGLEVRSHPLAGSAPRGEGEEEDARLGAGLLGSGKDRLEHALVVEDVAARLRPFVEELRVSPQPVVRKMANVQHLSSEVSGRLAAPRSLLRLVGDLHPTPAVGGTPRDESLAFIEKVEGLDRGWYSGGLGSMDADGNGQAVVALRCALLRRAESRLYAGAGIVSGSDPEAELAETRLKLRPLLDLLAAT
ncbi:MAG: isochorismate synthase [Acidimicrobiia bacterium]